MGTILPLMKIFLPPIPENENLTQIKKNLYTPLLQTIYFQFHIEIVKIFVLYILRIHCTVKNRLLLIVGNGGRKLDTPTREKA